jgi:hypothetical protein
MIHRGHPPIYSYTPPPQWMSLVLTPAQIKVKESLPNKGISETGVLKQNHDIQGSEVTSIVVKILSFRILFIVQDSEQNTSVSETGSVSVVR